MKRAMILILALILALAFGASAETAPEPDRQILFAESRIIAGGKVSLTKLPQVVRLTADAPAETKLMWQSSNPAVATVNAWGQVTTLTPGGTRIVAYAKDNPQVAGAYELYVVWPVEEMVPADSEITLTLDPSGTRDETDLFYTIRPSDAWLGGVIWSTSNAAVAVVDETGHVTAVAPGSAVVTAEAVMPLGCPVAKKAAFRVSVRREAEAVTVSPESVDLLRGESALLKAEVIPADATDRKIIWTSSDPSVARVDNGRVTAVSSGSCEITCASADGKLSASSRVTVTWPTQRVDLSEKSLKLDPGGQAQLKAAVRPSDADDTKVVWSSSNPQIASVDETGLVTGLLGGDCVITCAPADGVGRKARCEVHVPSFSIGQAEWTVDQVTGVTIPISWHSYEPVALELNPNSGCFRAVWDEQSNILIQPLSAGVGTLTVQDAAVWGDRIELRITVTEDAVTNPEDYPRLTYTGLKQDTPEIGAKGKILGRVLQRIEQPDLVVMLVGTAGEDWTKEPFWVEHLPEDPVTKAGEGQLVIVCGTYQGVYTYEDAAGGEVSVPALKARQITVR